MLTFVKLQFREVEHTVNSEDGSALGINLRWLWSLWWYWSAQQGNRRDPEFDCIRSSEKKWSMQSVQDARSQWWHPPALWGPCSQHSTGGCPRYVAMSVDERLGIVMVAKLCLFCSQRDPDNIWKSDNQDLKLKCVIHDKRKSGYSCLS